MMTPVGRLILLRSFPRSGLVSAMNWMTIPAMVGPTVGPIVGGFLTSYASWRAIFYLNIPIGLLGAGFPEAVAYVVRLAFAAEAADHHPDIDIRYKRVTLTYSTHSEGGLTEKDFAGAETATKLAGGPN